MIDHERCFGHRWTVKNKCLEIQTVNRRTDDGSSYDSSFATAFGSWAMIAPPLPPETDAQGNIKSACEALTTRWGDDVSVFATRDVRISRYFQDLVGGEVAISNAFGSRLALRRNSAALNHGGGFLNFDSTSKTVALVGIPESEGKPAPYLTMSTKGIGMVSSTGQASMQVEGSGVSMSGASVVMDAGTVSIGKGAAEPIVTYSQLQQVLIQVNAAIAILNTKAGGVGVALPILPPPAGKSIRVPWGG